MAASPRTVGQGFPLAGVLAAGGSNAKTCGKEERLPRPLELLESPPLPDGQGNVKIERHANMYILAYISSRV